MITRYGDHDSTGYHVIQETFNFHPEPGTSAKDDLMIGNLDIWTLGHSDDMTSGH